MHLQLMLEPCPCTSLVKAVKVLAIADIGWCLLNIIMISFVLVDLYHPGTLYRNDQKIGKPVSSSLSAFTFSDFPCHRFVLWAKKKNAGLCCLWLVFSAVDLVFSLVIAILQVPLYTKKAPEVAVASFLNIWPSDDPYLHTFSRTQPHNSNMSGISDCKVQLEMRLNPRCRLRIWRRGLSW
ncbi:hypothetical protein Ocin01_19445 [Orchesella cincta]|uniref:Uncharacterized protein n=1 Tax=Orchesella cincta TaxID=48709 RepID=A0A1D2M2Q0_ORCCI|nr:hypothetical protein Ocin01_19445 [Orchesella cincta]